MSLDTPNSSGPLVDIIENGQTYIISRQVSVQYMPDRQMVAQLELEPGDTIFVENYDSQKGGLVFRCAKVDQPVIISPNEARKIEVE